MSILSTIRIVVCFGVVLPMIVHADSAIMADPSSAQKFQQEGSSAPLPARYNLPQGVQVQTPGRVDGGSKRKKESRGAPDLQKRMAEILLQAMNERQAEARIQEAIKTDPELKQPLFGDDPPDNVKDWLRYRYKKNHRFYYGGKGAGEIGNGLCIGTDSGSGSAQVKNGYCASLGQILSTPGTCANRELSEIIRKAGPSGSGIGDLTSYCSKFGGFSYEQKMLVFQQTLAALITQESGWKVDAQEPGWTRADGVQMGGKGLFQIGVHDQDQDPDCNGLNSSSILTADPNMKCGACIALKNLNNDSTMGHGVGDAGARGMARYFGPFRDAQVKKRSAIMAAVNSYCESIANGMGMDSNTGSSSVR